MFPSSTHTVSAGAALDKRKREKAGETYTVGIRLKRKLTGEQNGMERDNVADDVTQHRYR